MLLTADMEMPPLNCLALIKSSSTFAKRVKQKQPTLGIMYTMDSYIIKYRVIYYFTEIRGGTRALNTFPYGYGNHLET